LTLRSEVLDDLNTIFDSDDFAEVATLSGGGTVNGIVNEPYEDALGVENASLTFTGKTSDLSALVHGSTMVIGGITYYVIGIEPNRIGMTVLKLSKDA
jgi:hypothetical protein